MYQVKENEMGWAHTMNGTDEKCIQKFGQEAWREENTWNS
jgi:hypothetical protein